MATKSVWEILFLDFSEKNPLNSKHPDFPYIEGERIEDIMEYTVAAIGDIEEVLSLHKKYHVDTVSESDKENGFVTTQFTRDLLLKLIETENGLFVAKNGDEIIAYAMSASWKFCSIWPMFQHMIGKLHEIQYLGQTLNTENSYQYGPICIDREYRGTGVLEGVFEFARSEMNKKYPILVTFVNKSNPRSIKAHVDKLGLDLAMEFEYNNNSYLELLYDTSKPQILL
jgi:hypothetical protein